MFCKKPWVDKRITPAYIMLSTYSLKISSSASLSFIMLLQQQRPYFGKVLEKAKISLISHNVWRKVRENSKKWLQMRFYETSTRQHFSSRKRRNGHILANQKDATATNIHAYVSTLIVNKLIKLQNQWLKFGIYMPR